MEKIHLQQALLWKKAADYVAQLRNSDHAKYGVAISMAIHAIIKANDSLTFKFMKITARKHDEARRLFEDLIKNGYIDSNHNHFRNTLQDAINNKAKAEYKGSFFSKKDFEDIERKADKFIKMAITILN